MARKPSWVSCTLLVGTVVGRNPVPRIYAARHVSAFALLAGSVVKRSHILHPSRIRNWSNPSHGIGMDLGSTLHQEWQLIGDNHGACHVE